MNLPENTSDHPADHKRFSILFRTSRLTFLVVIFTMGLFLFLILPYQENVLIDRMASQAAVIATSLEQITVTSIVVEDYSSVVDHSLKVVQERSDIRYLVITRKDGFSLIHTASGWKYQTLDTLWVPEEIGPARFIESDLVGEEVFHFTHPIYYSGIDWGWIHVGLSLKAYDADLKSIYARTLLLAALCMLAGTLLSYLFARRLSQPILHLNRITQKVAEGDLTSRVRVATGDEIESLATSFNQMTGALQAAQRELEIRVQARTAELSRSNERLRQEILERKRAEQGQDQLVGQVRQLQKMEAVGQLTAGIAHNFNNMLGIIMGNLEITLQEASKDQAYFLGKSIETCQEAAKMIQDMMVFSRKSPSKKEAVDLQDILTEAVDICRRTFDRKIEILSPASQSLPLMMGNAGQLKQVVLNLCINARDALDQLPATRNSLQIRIGAETVDIDEKDAQRHLEATSGKYLRLSVSDNGPGMDEITINHILEPFFTTKDVSRGTGLGLSTVYSIMQQHGGWIEVKSQQDQGATFTCYLPVAEHDTVIHEPEKMNQAPGGTETLLIVEDEMGIREVVTSLFERAGYTVLLAKNGKEGLEIFNRDHQEIDLILLDLTMPELSGREVLTEISFRNPNTRVIIFTGHRVNSDEFPDVRAIVQKPFHSHELLAAVRKALDD